jgi:hypothetical protein
MRSHGELLAPSGYQQRPGDFNDLLRILDGELRLITPTDPEGWGNWIATSVVDTDYPTVVATSQASWRPIGARNRSSSQAGCLRHFE